MYDDAAVSEDDLTWSGYRLKKRRMSSIKDDSTFIQFTCEYEKNLGIKMSDYVQIPLLKIDTDILQSSVHSFDIDIIIDQGGGKVGGSDLTHCRIRLYQNLDQPLHVFFGYIHADANSACANNPFLRFQSGFVYFGGFNHLSDEMKEFHRCATNENSTTQLYGLAYNIAQARPVI